LIGFGIQSANASSATPGDYLVKLKPGAKKNVFLQMKKSAQVQDLGLEGWVRIKTNPAAVGVLNAAALRKTEGVEYVQPNYKVRLLENPSLAAVREKLKTMGDDDGGFPGMPGQPIADNPEIPAIQQPSSGQDPLFNNQWGMLDIGVTRAWNKTKGRNNVVVAVIDTGVDYTHEDIVENLWRNTGEIGTDSQGRDKSKNGVDDDNNGYIDDSIGWDFVSNDNKPFDLSVDPMQLILGGGNPGHGTHCAGNVAARGFNGKGVSGVAPGVSIMSLRFLSEKGEGTTAGAVQAINYALRNGAHITSNSWGSEGEDEGDAENRALREAIAASQTKGVLFVAAAGNGHSGVGYDNDRDSKPGYPASYNDDIIISVAALDVNNNLGSFSNWGKTSVDIGAPGVKVYSTTVNSNYADTVIDMLGMKITWDGTSMATPHVAGAAALYLSHNPNASWQQIKAALLTSATKIPALTGKIVSDGKLNVEGLLNSRAKSRLFFIYMTPVINIAIPHA
jgi:subtilisin family serine protease